MKSIPNKAFTTPDGSVVTVAQLLETSLSSPPPEGFDFATMRARLRVSAVLDAPRSGPVGGDIELEDADYQTAQEAIKKTRWVRYSKHLVEFGELFGL